MRGHMTNVPQKVTVAHDHECGQECSSAYTAGDSIDMDKVRLRNLDQICMTVV
jgi:hypothetical protein